ncbi:MAG TPA: thioredoxin [Gammaproteobacteria bacterium]|jgi:thioredoxin 1|nr:thioredoxin [Gammaproteobacteria bacterium]
MSATILMTGKASFDQDVIQSPLPVLVDYWAEWCAPCKAIGPLLDELAVEYQGKLRIAKVNMDEDVQIGQKYGVRGMPTLMIFKNGSVEAQKTGAMSKSQLTAFIEANL